MTTSKFMISVDIVILEKLVYIMERARKEKAQRHDRVDLSTTNHTQNKQFPKMSSFLCELLEIGATSTMKNTFRHANVSFLSYIYMLHHVLLDCLEDKFIFIFLISVPHEI